MVTGSVLERWLQTLRAYLRQPPADGAGALGAEVEGKVLLALVEVTQVLALLLVRHSQNASDRLADAVAIRLY